MIILTIRTDKPLAEIGLWRDTTRIAEVQWEAHRELADTIHTQIATMLAQSKLDWQSIQAVAVYKGPGSFTGLRIGISVANALALGLHIPIVGQTGPSWQQQALEQLIAGKNESVILPEYGADANITLPKK